ncbi:hypothetical protein SOVF_095370, partial [Spinacia oleracea]
DLNEPLIQIKEEHTHVWLDLPVAFDYGDVFEAPPTLLKARNMRSLIFPYNSAFCDIDASSVERVVLKCKSLRALNLSSWEIKVIPDSIGGLIHLRYLNLASNTALEYLPDAITRLQNLQTLNLKGCLQLKELPREFSKLTKLRHLAISKTRLTDIPSGFVNMTSLQELDWFPVGKTSGIDALPVSNLVGNLKIEFKVWHSNAVLEAERANLNNSLQLVSLKLDFFYYMSPKIGEEEEEEAAFREMDQVLMRLRLPPNLRYFTVENYDGIEVPRRWLDGLVKLISIKITRCHNCRVLPHLSRLPCLKYIYLDLTVCMP